MNLVKRLSILHIILINLNKEETSEHDNNYVQHKDITLSLTPP